MTGIAVKAESDSNGDGGCSENEIGAFDGSTFDEAAKAESDMIVDGFWFFTELPILLQQRS
jgi:hypothetical protein